MPTHRLKLVFYKQVAVVCTLIFSLYSLSALAQSNSGAGRLAQIQSKKLLRVCIWPDYYSISFRNPRNAQLSGIDIDLARELGKDLGVEVQFVDSSFAKLIENLSNDLCDVAMHGVGITPQRQEKLSFTQPYLRSDFYAVTTKTQPVIKQWDDLDKPGNILGVQGGTVMEPTMRAALKQAQIEVVLPPKTREQELEAGRVDAFITDYPYSRRILDNADWAKLISPPKPFHLTSYAYAIRKVENKNDEAWLNQLNQFVSAIKRDGRLLNAAKRYRLEPIVVSD